jgi:hypothetical protein
MDSDRIVGALANLGHDYPTRRWEIFCAATALIRRRNEAGPPRERTRAATRLSVANDSEACSSSMAVPHEFFDLATSKRTPLTTIQSSPLPGFAIPGTPGPSLPSFPPAQPSRV